MRYTTFLFLLLCTSCIQLGGTPGIQQYYLLEPRTSAPVVGETEFNLELQQVKLPAYLDQPNIVTHDQANMIKFSDSERWAGPLVDNISLVIRADLAQSFPNARISISPWEIAGPEPYRLNIVIERFSGQPGRMATLVADWSIIDSRHTEIASGHFNNQLPVGDSYRDLVQGLNKNLHLLDERIAKDLAQR